MLILHPFVVDGVGGVGVGFFVGHQNPLDVSEHGTQSHPLFFLQSWLHSQNQVHILVEGEIKKKSGFLNEKL